jgi:hypothetical protein
MRGHNTNWLRASPDNQMVDLPLPHQISRIFEWGLRPDTVYVHIHHIRNRHRRPRSLNVAPNKRTSRMGSVNRVGTKARDSPELLKQP